jgi:ribulose-5-phosphate 4-epimerase/fuculose-1-phosphate aldolase
LGDRKGVLLRSHGLCTTGCDLNEAVRIAVLTERIAQIFVHAEMMGGATKLPADAIEAERAVYLMRSGIEGID